MDDLYAQVKLLKQPGGKAQVVVTVRNQNQSLYRMSVPLQTGDDIKDLISQAIKNAQEFGTNHEASMRNPLGVDMASGVE